MPTRAIPKGLSLQPSPYGVGIHAIPKELSPEADPVRDQTSMSLAQKDQLLEIGSRVRLGKPIIYGRLSVSRDKSRHYCHEVRTNLLFTMSNRTSGKPEAHHKPFLRMTFFSDTSSLLNTKGNGGAGRDRTDDILLAKQALSQLSYGP